MELFIVDSVGGGNLTAGANELILNSSSNYFISISASISGTGGLTSAGNNTISLQGVNTYSGTTTVGGFGPLQIGSASALGNSTSIVINSSTLQLGGAKLNNPAANSVVLNSGISVGIGPTNGWGTGTLDTSVYSLTVAGSIGNNGAGSGKLIKNGVGGVLTLSGVNSYSGGTLVNGGTVSVSADSGLGAAPGSFSMYNVVLSPVTNQSSACN